MYKQNKKEKQMTPLSKINKNAWSASSINKLMAQPASWVLSYIYNCYGSQNPAMVRGLATEIGFNAYVKTEFGDMESAVMEATRFFNKETALQAMDQMSRDKERASLEGFITQAVEALAPYGKPVSMQNKLEMTMEGVIDPFVGYDDYVFEKNITIDLKTSHRVPSQISDPHKRQMALYQMMKPEHKILICYVSPKKYAIYEMTMEEVKEICEQIKCAAQSAEKLLDIYDDPKDLYKLFSPDYSSSFYWNDPITRAEAKRVWGY
jgi:hypothetical protein